MRSPRAPPPPASAAPAAPAPAQATPAPAPSGHAIDARLGLVPRRPERQASFVAEFRRPARHLKPSRSESAQASTTARSLLGPNPASAQALDAQRLTHLGRPRHRPQPGRVRDILSEHRAPLMHLFAQASLPRAGFSRPMPCSP
ncbi:MAG: hypothetical protein EOO54_26815 [Haliea sp.]|nr:MAG: hypothetical protein EOO54_26815 [Haliea sp.]